MIEKGKDFIFYYKPYIMPSAGLHGPLHMARYVHSVSPCSCPRARSACTHTVVLPAAAWAGGRGVHVLRFTSLFPLND